MMKYRTGNTPTGPIIHKAGAYPPPPDSTEPVGLAELGTGLGCVFVVLLPIISIAPAMAPMAKSAMTIFSIPAPQLSGPLVTFHHHRS